VHLPAGASQLPAQALAAATNPQVLPNQAYHDEVVGNAVRYGGQAAHGLLDQVFTALQHSLAVGIQQGMVVVLVFGLVMLGATLFLKNLPLRATRGAAPAEGAEASATAASNEASWARGV
jgi:hypothetical protein